MNKQYKSSLYEISLVSAELSKLLRSFKALHKPQVFILKSVSAINEEEFATLRRLMHQPKQQKENSVGTKWFLNC